MLGVTSAVGGPLQLAASTLGRILPRHGILVVGKRLRGHLLCARRPRPELLSVFLWTVMSRVAGAAQHPVRSALLSQSSLALRAVR